MSLPGSTIAAPVTGSRPTSPRAHLFTAGTVEDYRRAVTQGIERVAARVAEVDRPGTGVTPDELAPRVAGIDLDRPLGDTAAALDELHDVYLRDAVYFHHPRYLAHLNCPVVIPALLGEAVLSAVNSSLDTWDQSAGGTLIERRLVDWTAERIGFGPAAADGVFTSGGTQSNLQALLLAREEAYARIVGGGTDRPSRPEVLSRLRIITSAAGHFSVQKAAKLLGLGADAVLTVATDAGRRMRTDELAETLDRCRREGHVVMAVVATAGTTDFGTIDPLHRDRRDLRRRTASGCTSTPRTAADCWSRPPGGTCSTASSGPTRSPWTTTSRSSSRSAPAPCSSATGGVLRHATWHADYLNPARMAEQRIPNQVDKSLQTTRRFDALKLWLTLRIMGADAVGALFDEVIDLAAAAWRLLADDPRFEVVTRSQLSTVVFRYLPRRCQPATSSTTPTCTPARRWPPPAPPLVAGTKVDGAHYLKLTLLNPETTLDDIAHVLDLIAEHAGWYARTRATAELSSPVG